MIGILGGGISGLALAWHLDRRGVPFVLLEAREAPGGVMRSHEAEGMPLDIGPQRTRLTAEVRELVEGAGLLDEMLEAPEELPLYVYRNGRLREVPFTLGRAVTTDLLGWGEKLRILAEPFTAGPRPEETVETFFSRKFGRGAYRNMIGPLYGGLYASDPGRMYVRHGLAMTLEHFGVEGSLLRALVRRGGRARAELPTVSFTGGMQMLPLALARELGDRVRTGARVREVTALAEGSDHTDRELRFRLHVEGEDHVDVSRVVLALPAPDAASVLRTLDPRSAARIGELRYNRLAVVHLRALEPEGGEEAVPLRGFGYQIGFDEPLETRGVTWNGALFDRDALCAAYLGGMKHPELVDWEDERIGRVALSEFRTVTGRDARILRISRTWIPAWDGTWDALDGLALPTGVHVCANWNARPGIPGRAAAAARLSAELAG